MIVERISLFVLICRVVSSNGEYVIPRLTLQALKPTGFRASLPGDASIKLLIFEGDVHNSSNVENEPLSKIWGVGTQTSNGRLLFEDKEIPLEIGQHIKYRFFVSHNQGEIGSDRRNDTTHAYTNVGFASEFYTFEVKGLDPPDKDVWCAPSATSLYGRSQVCAEEVIFFDDFNYLREDQWQIEHYIPIDHPEHPFVSYQRLQWNPTVTTNEALIIMPNLQSKLPGFTNDSIYTGFLDLTSGCTHSTCSARAIGVNILPPVVSGRVTTSRFAFKYGKVEIRAKFPVGDWLYPEVLLEPLSYKYGTLNYASGIMKIALVRGNQNVSVDLYGGQNLVGGPIINDKCKTALEFYHKIAANNTFWNDVFHIYSLKWSQDVIELDVDGENWARYEPGANGLRSWLPPSCRGPWYDLLNVGGPMAPFDDYFRISLGVAVGGVAQFQDKLTTANGHAKPWRNRSRKAVYSFWQDVDNWLPTWRSPSMIIDYIKVTAL